MNPRIQSVGGSARALALALTATLVALQPAAHACTRVVWLSPDDQVFVGRTQDWTEKADSAFRVYPRGIARMGAVAENPHKWTSKYGSLVITGYDLATHEGVNEKGLSAQILYLAGESDYGKRDPRLEGIGVTQWVQYFLDNYATVAEAVEAQKSFAFQIDSLILPNGFPTLVHLSLADKSGDSAVIEYIAGKAKVYHDKRFTVMTNEPTYDKQIENLKQYRTFGGDKPLLGERTPHRPVRARGVLRQRPAEARQPRGRSGVHVQCHPERLGPLRHGRPGPAERLQHHLPDRDGPHRRALLLRKHLRAERGLDRLLEARLH
jgi:choloylglycine hydrolase